MARLPHHGKVSLGPARQGYSPPIAIRIREDGRIFCAAMSGPLPGDRYVDDRGHYLLSVELGILVTEPMTADPENPGRGGHSAHGEWFWFDQVPLDAVIEPPVASKR